MTDDDPPAVVLRARTFRTGRQVLYRRGATFYVSIRNRSYSAAHEIPIGRVPAWFDYFDRPSYPTRRLTSKPGAPR